MNRILLFCTTLLTLSAIRPYAQLTAPAATVTQMTNYTNGAAPDPVYIFCDPGPSGNPTPASLTAIPPGGPAGWKFEWFIYNQATNSWNVLSTENNVPSSTITNLASGGYRVVVTDGNNVVQGCFRAWVWHKRTVLNINPLTAGCQPFTINGALQTDNSFTYYNPPPDPFIVGPNTTVTVCFSANHTYVSDLGFFLIGPASCGSPTVPLAPHPQAINAANGCCCNANDNVNNLCFSTNNNNLLAVCGAAAPLTGNFGIYGQGVPNNYNTNNNNWGPIFGCDATQGGWSVQIYDCIAQDVGALTNATISFSGNASCGPSNIVYNSGNINSVINDNSCNPQTASIYTVPPPPPTVAQTINTADTYTWTSSPALPGFPVAGTAFPLNINPVPQQDTWFYFTVTNSIGCVRVDSVFFDYVAPDEPTITIPAVFCYDSPARVLAADLPGGVWSGTGIADPATGLFDPVAAGAGAHQVIYTMPPPCGKADTVTVTVSSRTILNGVAVPSTCFGADNGSINVAVTSGSLPLTASWNTVPVQNTVSAAGLPPGNHTLTVQNTHGCIQTFDFATTEPTQIILAMNTVDVNCPGGNNGQATVTAQGGTAPYAYSWNTVPPQTAGNATALAAGSYTVTVTDDHLCTAQADADIQTLSVPPTIGGAVTEESCAGVGDGAIGLNVSGGTGPFTYVWDSGQTTQDIAQLGGGTYTVTLTDVYACTYTQPFNVAAGNAFAFTFSVTDVLCKGDNTGSIQVSPVSGNPPYTYLLNGTPGPPAQYDGLPAGNYNVQVTDDRGCDTVYLALIDEPLLALTAAVNTVDVNCPGGNNGQATVTAQGGTAPYAYSWNTVPPQTAGNATALAAGSYTVTVTDDHLCTAQADADIQTLSVPPTIGGAVTEESCAGVGDGAIGLNVSGGTGPFTYVWDSGQTTQDIAQLGGGTYTVTLTDVYACTYTQPFNVAAGSAFAFNFSTVPVLCHGESTGNILLSPLTGNPPYTYFLDGTVVSPDRYSHLPAGNYTVRVTDSRGCDTVYLASLTEPPAVFADSTHEQIRLGDHLNLNPQIGGGTGNLTITWTPPRNIDCDRCINPLAWPTQSTVYYITVTDQNGCTETGRVFVEVFHDGPFIPNAFTPGNRDELNSRWGVSDYGVRDFELMVFDRWGNRLFRSDNIYEGWDGMAANGILCEGGMYVYKTRITYIDGTEKTMLGHVTLLR